MMFVTMMMGTLLYIYSLYHHLPSPYHWQRFYYGGLHKGFHKRLWPLPHPIILNIVTDSLLLSAYLFILVGLLIAHISIGGEDEQGGVYVYLPLIFLTSLNTVSIIILSLILYITTYKYGKREIYGLASYSSFLLSHVVKLLTILLQHPLLLALSEILRSIGLLFIALGLKQRGRY